MELIQHLEHRFKNHMHRHKDLKWEAVVKVLDAKTLKIIQWMEDTKGEPDFTYFDKQLVVVDFSKETPHRRALCYDEKALHDRKANKPEGSALQTAKEHGLMLVDEKQYYTLQKLEPLDMKSSSWLLTPDDVRAHGGAIFGDRRYDRVFIYHNGADSYYSARGFRGYRVLD